MNTLINGLLNVRSIFILWLVSPILLLNACTPASPVEPPSTQNPMAESQQAASCNFSDLTGYVHAENNFTAVQGLINLSNYTENPCLINTVWEITVTDPNGSPLVSNSIALENTNIQSENYLSINFVWQNHCLEYSAAEFYINILDPDTQQAIHLPIEDPNGNLMSTPPACKDHNLEQSFLLQISQ